MGISEFGYGGSGKQNVSFKDKETIKKTEFHKVLYYKECIIMK